MEKKVNGLKLKLYLLTVAPVLLVGLWIMFMSVSKMNTYLHEMAESRLSDMGETLSHAYDALYQGDWNYDEATGAFTKGGHDLYATYDMLDSLKEENGAHITIFCGDTRRMTTVLSDDGSRFVGTQAGQDVVDVVLKQRKPYFSTHTVINNEEYYSYYTPLFNTDSTVAGMFFVGAPRADVLRMIYGAILTVAAGAILLILLDVVVVSMITRGLVKAINNCVEAVATLASGNLNVHAQVGRVNQKDELGFLARSINSMAERFSGITRQIRAGSDVMKQNSNTLASVAERTNLSLGEVSTAIEDVANGATSQANDTQDAASSMAQMGSSIESIVSDINGLASAAELSQETSKSAEKAMEELIAINMDTKTSVEKIVKQSETNVNAASRIQEVVNVISDIASQTNLLSLNASIEAARAGEQGRGFGVVALEVGKLADDSSKSAAEIEEIIKELVENIAETSELTGLLNHNTKKQIDKLETTRQDFDTVLLNVNKMVERTLAVQTEIQKIDDIRKTIEGIVENLSALSQENAASSQQTTASVSMVAASMEQLKNSTQEISALAEELTETISYFKE